METDAATRTVLFCGASNTRGYGVDPAVRFAAVLQNELGATLQGPWRFAVSTALPGFHNFRALLETAIPQTQPAVLVIQCPTSPISFTINYPRWLNALLSLQRRHLDWRRERAVAAEINREPAGTRSRRDALREGRFVESVNRFRFTRFSALRKLRSYAGRRYGVLVTTTVDEYVEGVMSLLATARAHFHGPILFIGPLPMSEEGYPGYFERARESSRKVARRLAETAPECSFIDVLQPLAPIPSAELLLSDHTHLTAEGHRRLAELLLPELRRAMRASVASTAPSR